MKIWPFDMLIRLAVVLLAMCTASAAQTSTSKGILRFGYTTGTTSFDPARSSSGGDRALLLPVYDRLVRLSNQGEPQPMLATKWEFTRNGAGLVLTLRQGVTFQDGTSVDADAVKANLDRFRTLPESVTAWWPRSAAATSPPSGSVPSAARFPSPSRSAARPAGTLANSAST